MVIVSSFMYGIIFLRIFKSLPSDSRNLISLQKTRGLKKNETLHWLEQVVVGMVQENHM